MAATVTDDHQTQQPATSLTTTTYIPYIEDGPHHSMHRHRRGQAGTRQVNYSEYARGGPQLHALSQPVILVEHFPMTKRNFFNILQVTPHTARHRPASFYHFLRLLCWCHFRWLGYFVEKKGEIIIHKYKKTTIERNRGKKLTRWKFVVVKIYCFLTMTWHLVAKCNSTFLFH